MYVLIGIQWCYCLEDFGFFVVEVIGVGIDWWFYCYQCQYLQQMVLYDVMQGIDGVVKFVVVFYFEVFGYGDVDFGDVVVILEFG